MRIKADWIALAGAAVAVAVAGVMIRPAGAVYVWDIGAAVGGPPRLPADYLSIVKENAWRYRPLTALVAISYKVTDYADGRAAVSAHTLFGLRLTTAHALGHVEVDYGAAPEHFSRREAGKSHVRTSPPLRPPPPPPPVES